MESIDILRLVVVHGCSRRGQQIWDGEMDKHICKPVSIEGLLPAVCTRGAFIQNHLPGHNGDQVLLAAVVQYLQRPRRIHLQAWPAHMSTRMTQDQGSAAAQAFCFLSRAQEHSLGIGSCTMATSMQDGVISIRLLTISYRALPLCSNMCWHAELCSSIVGRARHLTEHVCKAFMKGYARDESAERYNRSECPPAEPR